MPKQMLMSAPLRCPRLVTCLMLVACGWPLLTPSAATSNDLHSLADLTHPYASIFSPLLKALSEHGGSRWNPGPGGKMTPEESYMTYLTEVYRKTSRVQRGLDGRRCDTVRLIKPQDECFPQSNKEGYMQDLSYNLGQVRRKEHLLKSALVYSFAHVGVAPANRACYLSIQEQERSEHCHLCSVVHYAVNFTGSKDGRNMRSWVEVDVTSFLKPLFKFHGRNIKLLINVTCHDEGRASGGGGKEALKFTLRPPPLLLYLTDTSKIGHRRLQEDVKALQAPVAAENTFHKQVFVKSESRLRQKRRWKRDSPKSKRGGKGLDPHLPELLPSSEFPTNDCALYDFRVRFSQLKLDHWIVFPPKYNPRYCRGICPRTMGFIYGSPVHTMVQNIIYEKLDSSVPRPSCIPSHYSPLSVMIFEEDGSYVYKEFEDMVATRCTCR